MTSKHTKDVAKVVIGIIATIVLVSFLLTLLTEALFDKFGWWRGMEYYSDFDLFKIVLVVWIIVLFILRKTISDSTNWENGGNILKAFSMGFWIVFSITLLFDIHFESIGLIFDDYIERGIFSVFVGIVVGLFLLKRINEQKNKLKDYEHNKS